MDRRREEQRNGATARPEETTLKHINLATCRLLAVFGTNIMTRKWLCALGILASGVMLSAQQRWLTPTDRNLMSDEVWTEFPLPNPASGPTTIALAADGSGVVHRGGGNRIGRLNPEGAGLKEVPSAQPDSSPRIIALGSDGTCGSRSTPGTGWAGLCRTARLRSSRSRRRTACRGRLH
jgi:hypothetical protein